MDFLTIYAIYMTGVILLIGLWAVRVPHEDVRTVFALAFMWPVSILAIAFVMILNATGWDMEIAKGAKMFGVRRPGNPQAKGIAITIFTAEFQFYTMRKA